MTGEPLPSVRACLGGTATASAAIALPCTVSVSDEDEAEALPAGEEAGWRRCVTGSVGRGRFSVCPTEDDEGFDSSFGDGALPWCVVAGTSVTRAALAVPSSDPGEACESAMSKVKVKVDTNRYRKKKRILLFFKGNGLSEEQRFILK